MKKDTITEGATKLEVPDPEEYDGPEEPEVFYNPLMEKDRTLSVRILRKFCDEPSVVDSLSATGARAIRYNQEADAEVLANDANPKAVEFIENNIKLNSAEGVEASNNDANRIFLEGDRVDAVDIDPFGSPAPFLNNAFKKLKKKRSLLAVTATDLGALSGHYPKTCFRRYGVQCKNNPWEHEVGLRNLIYSIYQFGALNQFAIKPLLCYWRRHYYRCFIEVRNSKRGVNRNMSKIGYILFCRECGKRKKVNLFDDIKPKCSCGEQMEVIGPTWIGYLGDDEFLENLEIADLHINRMQKEINVKDLHYDTHYIGMIKNIKVKKRKHYIEKLRSRGYKAYKTIFTGHGFRTNAPQEEVMNLF